MYSEWKKYFRIFIFLELLLDNSLLETAMHTAFARTIYGNKDIVKKEIRCTFLTMCHSECSQLMLRSKNSYIFDM